MSGAAVADDLPLLGESLALDAVNSWYGVEPDVIDFLDDRRIRAWVGGLVAVHRLPGTSLDRDDERRLRAVRDAIWTVVHAALDHARPPPRAIAVVNDAARLAPAVVGLAWTAAGPTRDAHLARADEAPLAGRLAVSAIELVTGVDGPRVRRCARPGCSMLYVQHHGHRRFCHPSCSHALRQERYRAQSHR